MPIADAYEPGVSDFIEITLSGSTTLREMTQHHQRVRTYREQGATRVLVHVDAITDTMSWLRLVAESDARKVMKGMRIAGYSEATGIAWTLVTSGSRLFAALGLPTASFRNREDAVDWLLKGG